jgi:hypothetical protein
MYNNRPLLGSFRTIEKLKKILDRPTTSDVVRHARRGLILTYLRNNSHLGLYAGGARWQVLAHRNRSKQTAAAMARPHDRLATGSGA